MAVVVTIAKGYDLSYIWKTQDHTAERVIGGYYINAAQAGEPAGRWWGPGAQALGFTSGQVVERRPYDVVYQQRDPRTGFIKIFENMAKFDMMNQFVTHVGGGLFACPQGAAEGEFIGQRLFESA